MPDKQNSNETGLSFAEETSFGVLPGTPEWFELDPNSYNDFGGEVTTIARQTINKDRQVRKGTVVRVAGAGGFNVDVTYDNLWRLFQGFFFKDVAEKATTKPMNATQVTITNVDASVDNEYDAASGLSVFNAGHLIFAEGFTNAGNNGLKRVASVTAGTNVEVDEALVDETPPAAAFFRTVGFEFDSATCDVDATGDLPRLTRASGTQDWTDTGIVAGDMIYVGGDAAGDKFTTAANNGWGRVKTITASAITFDKFDGTMVNETGTGKTIRIFFGDRLNNDTDGNNINKRYYNLERTLGNDGSGVQSEYITGATPSEMTMNVQTADKVTCDLSFVGKNHENRDGTTGVKSGNRNSLTEGAALNTSSDIPRIKMAVHSATNENPTALFAYMQDLTLNINNNISPNEGVGVTGAFAMNEGSFTVTGEITAYFGDINASESVKNNDDVSLDFVLAKQNRGFAVDVPTLSLGGGRNEVVAQEPIVMQLSNSASKDATYNYTLSMTRYAYLPDAAAA